MKFRRPCLFVEEKKEKERKIKKEKTKKRPCNGPGTTTTHSTIINTYDKYRRYVFSPKCSHTTQSLHFLLPLPETQKMPNWKFQNSLTSHIGIGSTRSLEFNNNLMISWARKLIAETIFTCKPKTWHKESTGTGTKPNPHNNKDFLSYEILV